MQPMARSQAIHFENLVVSDAYSWAFGHAVQSRHTLRCILLATDTAYSFVRKHFEREDVNSDKITARRIDPCEYCFDCVNSAGYI